MRGQREEGGGRPPPARGGVVREGRWPVEGGGAQEKETDQDSGEWKERK